MQIEPEFAILGFKPESNLKNMKRIPLVFLGILLVGCTGSLNLHPRSDSAPESTSPVAEAQGDYEAIPASTPEDDFDEVLILYQEALDSAEAGNALAAQELFESAIINFAELNTDSLDIPVEEIEWLRRQIASDYASLLSETPELPAESSPSAVYISLSEFLGDSISSPEDLISLMYPAAEAPTEVDTLAERQLYPDVPLIVNSYVENALKFYRTKGRKVFTKWLERAGEAIPYYSSILKEEGLPEEIVYLGMIESGFSSSAYSRAHASGPWQFIASTARIYGLKVDYWHDERRDREKSTRAASRYLKKLHDEFGDWYLAFAAYNCGERRVQRAIRRAGKKDYWSLRKYLPRQTRDYVPSYLAARIICQNPTQYGFEPLDFKDPIPTRTVYVDGCVSLKEIAKCADADYYVIKKLNSSLKRGCTPPDAKNFPVLIPEGTGANFEEKIAKAPRLERSEWVRHRVRRGESLSLIAARYGVSMRSIMEIPANKLRSPHKIRAGQYLLIPVASARSTSRKEPKVGQPQPVQLTSSNGDVRTIYRVRKGDCLDDIAKKFQVRIADIKTWNHLWGKRYIYPGQKLIIWTKSSDESLEDANFAATKVITSNSGSRVHLVQPGDTLWDISRLYGVSVANLKKWNGIRSARRLKPGVELKLEP